MRIPPHAALVLMGLAACGAEDPGDVGAVRSAIVGGEPSTAAENAVVLLRNVRGECTGTLIAPNLVATARHCVSSANLAMICSDRGETLSGGQAGTDYDPAKIAVYVGDSFARKGVLDPQAVGARIVHDGSPTLCDHDLAFLVLSKNVEGPTAKVRLTEPPVVGETFRAVGWGLSVDATPPDRRVSRRGVRITAVGSNKERTVGPRELSATEGICDGDSGGPALSEKDGALLGVVTRGGSPRAAKLKPPEACVGDDIVNVYVSLAAHAKTVQSAFRAAGQPEPPAPPEDPCATTTCASGTTCAVESGRAVCSKPATAVPQPEDGCSISRAGSLAPWTPSFPLICAAVFGFVARRRGRRRGADAGSLPVS
jgi:hypothetical protein